MKWIPDETGRFPLRPFYDTQEIDENCDGIVIEFLTRKYGCVKLPLQTGDMELILGEHTTEFDPYADLTNEGEDIEGVTLFFKQKDPIVRISETLSQHYSQENRRRTTIAHELGHVTFHSGLFQRIFSSGSSEDNASQPVRCNRQNISSPQKIDWLEWQAFYAAGAFLMPISQMEAIAQEIFNLVKVRGPFHVDSSAGRGFLTRVTHGCQISSAAATVRLIQLGHITEDKALAISY